MDSRHFLRFQIATRCALTTGKQLLSFLEIFGAASSCYCCTFTFNRPIPLIHLYACQINHLTTITCTSSSGSSTAANFYCTTMITKDCHHPPPATFCGSKSDCTVSSASTSLRLKRSFFGAKGALQLQRGRRGFGGGSSGGERTHADNDAVRAADGGAVSACLFAIHVVELFPPQTHFYQSIAWHLFLQLHYSKINPRRHIRSFRGMVRNAKSAFSDETRLKSLD